MSFIKSLRARWEKWLWVDGVCNGGRARRHRLTGEVWFILWPKGHKQNRTGNHVYEEDYWYRMHEAHWKNFKKK